MDHQLSAEELPPISFYKEDVEFTLSDEQKLANWILSIIQAENCQLQILSYIFCSDQYLHQINLEYLQHDTYTDIITFPYESPPLIHGDIFISIDRVRENAQAFKVSFEEELRRVIIHGVLHLCGYPDKTEEEASKMRQKEEEALSKWSEI
jgi:rRNA maturation RNase YbeY